MRFERDNISPESSYTLEEDPSASKTSKLSSVLNKKMSRRELLKTGVGAATTLALGFPIQEASAQSDTEEDTIEKNFSENAEYLSIDANFYERWAATDRAVANGEQRTWFWGPEPFAQWEEEYHQAPGGKRMVRYFDKGRMEDNSYRAEGLWNVTTGHLAKELILGQRQISDTSYEARESARVNIAGDFDDPNGPTYETFAHLLERGPIPEGWVINETINRAGEVVHDDSYLRHDVSAARYVEETNHNVASVFDEFNRQYSGQMYGNEFYVTGYPISEAYWTRAKVGGVEQDVLVQPFERRVLTYTPNNPDGWQVEMGNVGRHYHRWLYGEDDGVGAGKEGEDVEKIENSRHIFSEVVQEDFEMLKQEAGEFDAYVNSLPERYDADLLKYRWWMGRALVNNGLLYGLSDVEGGREKAHEYIEKAWEYDKQIKSLKLNGGDWREFLPNTRSPEVFYFTEYVTALKFIGDELAQKDPNMVQEIVHHFEKIADHYASNLPPGNDADTINKDTYGETNAGIATFLMGMASLDPNYRNRDTWITSAHNYARGAFAVDENIGGKTISTAVVEGDELWLYNHWEKNAAYVLTTIGQLGQGEFFGRSEDLPVGSEFRHNADWALDTVMRYIDHNDLYTLEENKKFNGLDVYLLPWIHQLYSAYIDEDVLLKHAQTHEALGVELKDYTVPGDNGVNSDGFLSKHDGNFPVDRDWYIASVARMRRLLMDVSCQQRSGNNEYFVDDRQAHLFTVNG